MPRDQRPSITRSARKLSLLAPAVALVGLLLILAPNLGRIELRPGEANSTPAVGAETSTLNPGTNPTSSGGFHVLMRILFTVALGCLAFIIVGAIFKKALRAYLLAFVVICLVIIGAYTVLRPAAEQVEPDPYLAESGGFPLLEDRLAPPTETPPAEPPGWSFAAVAIAISVGFGLLLAVAWATLLPRWRQRTQDHAKTELEELIETVASAADEIQLGGDPRSAVLRCYREMIRIFARQKPFDHAHMTARELADALHRAGFTVRHVDQLTEIFELVRYGNRGGRPLAERAIGCLEAIRKAYAT